jgi:hypothetical protein
MASVTAAYHHTKELCPEGAGILAATAAAGLPTTDSMVEPDANCIGNKF